MRTFTSLFRTAGLCFGILQAAVLLAQAEPSEVNSALAQATPRPNMETKVFDQINQYRVSHHLKPLKRNSVADQQARQHSIQMANGSVPFGHQGVAQRFQAIKNAFPSATNFSENVAFNQGFSNPVRTAVQGWLNSPPHLKNIRSDVNRTGVGVASNNRGQYYFTQIFFRVGTQPPMLLENENEKEIPPIEQVSENPPMGEEETHEEKAN